MGYIKNTVIIMGICGLFAGCKGKKEQPKEKLKVTIEEVRFSNLSGQKEYVGKVEEASSTAVSFTGTGAIKRIYITEGQHVTKGQLIAELDKTQAQNLLATAQAQLRQANDAYARMKQLHDSNSLPEIKWVEIQSQVDQATSQMELAKKNLADCELKAPVNGIIGTKHMNSGETALPSEPVCNILDISTIKICINIPEKEIAGITPNTPSEIEVEAINEHFNGGHIEKGIQADMMTHTYDIRIHVANKGEKLLPGMVCKVTLYTGNEGHEKGNQVITVPIRSIQRSADNRLFVWLMQDGKAHRQYVMTGETVGNRIEIVSGLKENDRLIISGYQKVSEGTEVVS